ncbi:hypothetical protein V6Z12_A09G213800 [Gossypium hirsutum]
MLQVATTRTKPNGVLRLALDMDHWLRTSTHRIGFIVKDGRAYFATLRGLHF